MGRRKSRTPDSKRTDGRPWEMDTDGKPTLQDHHIVPKSRGGDHSRENILEGVPANIHWAYHTLFGNLKPLEIISVILKQFFRGGKFNRRYWRIVKRNSREPRVSPDEILTILVEEIFPKDWVPSEELVEMLATKRRNGLAAPKES